MQETWVQALGQKDPLEKEMATHPSILEIPWTEEPGGLQSMALQKRRTGLSDEITMYRKNRIQERQIGFAFRYTFNVLWFKHPIRGYFGVKGW